jgi:Mg-chelatase subunit ChlI
MTFQKHFISVFTQQKDPFAKIIGQDVAKKQLKSALIANRHILIHGPPGIGKTTLVKSIASLLPVEGKDNKDSKLKSKETKDSSERFIRVQGSPDLTAEDLLGDIDPIKALEFGPLSKEAFVPGKIFKANNGILFFDEVNRCSEKLQNALLQALEEGFVTIGSYDVDLPANFIFIGTINPHDMSTEKLNEAFMDRFDVIEMTYPETALIEKRIVTLNVGDIGVIFPPKLLDFLVEYVRKLRNPEKLVKFPSVRATIGIYQRACANAIIMGRSEVTLGDIEETFQSVLAHRIELKPSLKYTKSAEEFLSDEFKALVKANQLQTEQSDDADADDEDST